jgi:hypothetical protein
MSDTNSIPIDSLRRDGSSSKSNSAPDLFETRALAHNVRRVRISVRVDDMTAQQIGAVCIRTGHTVSNCMRDALSQWLSAKPQPLCSTKDMGLTEAGPGGN